MGAAATAWSIAACGVLDEPSDAGTDPTFVEPGGADVALVVAAIADEEAIADLCRSATRAHPSLAKRLDPQLRLQREQIAALRDALTEQPTVPTGPTPPVPQPTPADLDAVRRIAAQAAHRRRDDCLAAESGLLARLMGSIAASHAVWVASLSPPP